MTNQEILEKAIKKAIEGGFSRGTPKDDAAYYAERYINIPSVLIFNHDFAKALWPKTYMPVMGKDMHYDWKMHLERMVIADDPIQYLGDNI